MATVPIHMSEQSKSQSRIAAAFRLLLGIGTVIALAALVASRMLAVGGGRQNKAVMMALADIHRSQPALSVVSTNYAEVSRALGVSGFEIKPDQAAFFDGLALQGGATKEVLGHRAVYVRLARNPAEPATSLLVWPKGEFFQGLRSASRDVRGVRVDLWTDSDRVFALVRNRPQ